MKTDPEDLPDASDLAYAVVAFLGALIGLAALGCTLYCGYAWLQSIHPF
jgi:hypothetical protein